MWKCEKAFKLMAREEVVRNKMKLQVKLSPRRGERVRERKGKCEKCLVKFGTSLHVGGERGQGGARSVCTHWKVGHREPTKCHRLVWVKMRKLGKFVDNLMSQRTFFLFCFAKGRLCVPVGIKRLLEGEGERWKIYWPHFYLDSDIARTFLGLRAKLFLLKSSLDVARHACQLWYILKRQMFITFMKRSQRQRISAPLVCPCPKDWSSRTHFVMAERKSLTWTSLQPFIFQGSMSFSVMSRKKLRNSRDRWIDVAIVMRERQ